MTSAVSILPEQQLAALNDAYRVLRDPVGRVEYLLEIEGARKEGEQKQQAPPELLEEVFELNESLDELRDAKSSGGDLESLMRCITLVSDSEVVQAVGANAYRDYWARPSDPQRHVLELTAIYDKVISDNEFVRRAAEEPAGWSHIASTSARNNSGLISRQ